MSVPAADTVYALGTPPGRAAIAVIRICGPRAAEALTALSGKVGAPRYARYAVLRAADGAVIDRTLVVWFPGPKTETGEDMAELHLHGGPAVVGAAVAALAALGLRQAQPGEFARRAFAAGKLDLTEAEGLADLIDAETDAQRAQALAQMSGALKRLYEDWRERLIRISALVEAEIDFPDEADIADAMAGRLARGAAAELAALRGDVGAHLADGGRGERIRDGFSVALIGAPNAGKSSILNRLTGREAAIVTEIPGTTRDVLDVHLRLGGFAVVVADTAGLRDTADRIEAEGVRRAFARGAAADIRVGVAAGAVEAAALGVNLLPGDLRLLNKDDLGATAASPLPGITDIAVSALTGAGFDRFERVLTQIVVERLSARETPSLTRARHRHAEERALKALERAEAVLPRAPDLAGEDIRVAICALEELTGRVGVEDVLDRVFSQFCIGK